MWSCILLLTLIYSFFEFRSSFCDLTYTFKHTKIKSVALKQNTPLTHANRRVIQTLIERHKKFSFAVRKIMQVAQKS